MARGELKSNFRPLSSFVLYVPDYTTISTVPKFKDEAVLRQKFLIDGLSSAYIAKEFGCSQTAVRDNLRKYGIRKNTPNGKHKNTLKLGEKMVKGRVVPHKAELRTLETIYTMHTKEKLSPNSIAKILNTMRVPTKRQGKEWSRNLIINILNRKGIYGITQQEAA